MKIVFAVVNMSVRPLKSELQGYSKTIQASMVKLVILQGGNVISMLIIFVFVIA